MLSRKQLADGFTNLGLRAGDVVLVHSSYKSLGPVDGGPQTVVDALLDVLTPDWHTHHADLQFQLQQRRALGCEQDTLTYGGSHRSSPNQPGSTTGISSVLFVRHSGKA